LRIGKMRFVGIVSKPLFFEEIGLTIERLYSK
jgi:hypothetical protein